MKRLTIVIAGLLVCGLAASQIVAKVNTKKLQDVSRVALQIDQTILRIHNAAINGIAAKSDSASIGNYKVKGDSTYADTAWAQIKKLKMRYDSLNGVFQKLLK